MTSSVSNHNTVTTKYLMTKITFGWLEWFFFMYSNFLLDFNFHIQEIIYVKVSFLSIVFILHFFYFYILIISFLSAVFITYFKFNFIGCNHTLFFNSFLRIKIF